MVPSDARLSQSVAFDIPYAYVIHDRHRRALLPELRAHLERHGIQSVGRYGGWEYSAMEDALWQGRQAAEQTGR
jgi:protoporphyrinogen oxidase